MFNKPAKKAKVERAQTTKKSKDCENSSDYRVLLTYDRLYIFHLETNKDERARSRAYAMADVDDPIQAKLDAMSATVACTVQDPQVYEIMDFE